MTKEILRKKLLEKRTSPDKTKTDNIQKIFLNSEFFKKSKEILVYVSTAKEIATNRIIETALKNNKKVFCPLCTQKGIMEFLQIYSREDLEEGKYNILAPKKSQPKAENLENPIIIVPALAIDQNGFRIGYGGGYYDRYLSSNENIPTVGFCYEENLYSNLPHDKFDKPVDIIITERKIIQR